MSIVINQEEILPKFEGSASTTADEMRAYVKAFVDKLCVITGLSIMEELTEEHQYGIWYYLGEAGEAYPFLCVGNTESANYFFNHIVIGRTGPEKKPNFSKNSYSVNSQDGYSFSLNSSYAIKYYKSGSWTVFGFSPLGTNNVANKFLLMTIETANGLKKVMATFHNASALYFSYIPDFGNDSNTFINSEINIRSIIPYDKECITGNFSYNAVIFTDLFSFTNRMGIGIGSIFSKGMDKYLVLTKSTYSSMVLKIGEETTA